MGDPVRYWLDRLVASDPGLVRFRTGAWAELTAGAATALLVGAAHVLRLDFRLALIGAIVGLMTTISLQDATRFAQQRTLAAMAVVASLVVIAGAAALASPLWSAVGFLLVIFIGFELRRFGARGVALGTMAYQAYFYAMLLRPELGQWPWLALFIAAGCATAWWVRFVLWPERPDAVLRSELRSLRARVACLLFELARSLDAGAGRHRRRRPGATLARINGLALRIEQRLARFACDRDSNLGTLRDQLLRCEIAAETLRACSSAVTDRSPEERRSVASALLDVRTSLRETGAREAAPSHLHAFAADTGFDADLRWRFERAARTLVAKAPWTTELPPLRDSTAPGAPPAQGQPAAHRTRLALLHDEPTRHALQASVAAIGAMLVGYWLSAQHWYWAVFGAFVVFTRAMTRGQALAGAWKRIVGNVVGVALGLALAEFAHGNRPLELVLLFAFVAIAFYLFQAFQPAYIALLTAMLAMLYELLGKYSPGLLLLRLEEAVAGAVVAALSALVILPVRTSDQSDREGAALLREAAKLLRTALDASERPAPTDAVRDLDQRLQALRQALGPVTERSFPGPKSSHRLRLHRLALLVYCMRHFYQLSADPQNRVGEGEDWSVAAGTLAENMERVASALEAASEGKGQAPQLQPWPDAAMPVARSAASGRADHERIAAHWLRESNEVLRALAAEAGARA